MRKIENKAEKSESDEGVNVRSRALVMCIVGRIYK